MLVVQHMEHLLPVDLQNNRGDNGGCSGHAKPANCGERLLAGKIPSSQQRDGRFFPSPGNDCELGPATLDIKHRVGRAPLAEEVLLCFETKNPPSGSRSVEKFCGLKWCCLCFILLYALDLSAFCRRLCSETGLAGRPAVKALGCN